MYTYTPARSCCPPSSHIRHTVESWWRLQCDRDRAVLRPLLLYPRHLYPHLCLPQRRFRVRDPAAPHGLCHGCDCLPRLLCLRQPKAAHPWR